MTGANRWFAGPAVVLTPLGRSADDAAAHARWASRVTTLAAVLGWPAPRPVAHRHAGGTLLLFAAPAGALFTATEVNEWAWERSAAEDGETPFDIAHSVADATAPAHFTALATAEQRPGLAALVTAAAQHDLPALADDDALSLGAGARSLVWPLAALPSPDAVPWATLGRVPTALVTGSNGKTTTVRLLAAMATAAGRVPGLCSTEGVFVGGQRVEAGDWSGPAGARAVLRHPCVTAAVLETARGGLLRRGLAVDCADVAVVTNISPDHLGEYGIDRADDLAEVKLIVAHAVAGRGTLVLNADDPVLMAATERLPHAKAARAAHHALFAMDADHPRLQACRAAGGSTCGGRQARLILCHAGATHDLGRVQDFPLTLGGAAAHNTQNVAAAVLAGAVLGWPVQTMTELLQHFGASPADNPGRLERWRYRGATVLVDYAHNPEGLTQLLQVARSLSSGRLGLLLGQAGNRDDAAIADLARAAAQARPDMVVIKDLPDMLRGRVPGELPALITRELQAAGLPDDCWQRVPDEATGARQLLDWARPGDVLALPMHSAAGRAQLASWLTREADTGPV